MKINIEGLSANDVREIVERLRNLKLEAHIARFQEKAVLQTETSPRTNPSLFADIYLLF